MRTLLSSISMAVFVLSATALAAGSATTETRKVPEFHAVEVSGGAEVIIRRGDTSSVTLTGEAEALADYRTEVRGGVLEIAPTHQHLYARRSVRLEVVSPQPLDAVGASGGVHLTLESGAGRRLAMSLSGGTHVTAPALDLEALSVHASGGVELALGGKAEEERLDLSGGVQLDAARLTAARVVVDASGGCSLKVTATQSISGDASGGVELRVLGRPSSRVHASGGASVVVE